MSVNIYIYLNYQPKNSELAAPHPTQQIGTAKVCNQSGCGLPSDWLEK